MTDVKDVDGRHLAQVAARIAARPGLGTVFAEVFRRSRWSTLGFVSLGVFFLATRALPWAAGAFAIAALPFVLAAWAHRRARDYEQFLRAHAIGDAAAMQRCAARLRAMPNKPQALDFDLDVREAQVRVRGGADLGETLAALDATGWRAQLAGQPGAYDARVAVLHLAAERVDGAIDAMRSAAQASGNDAARMMDLALLEARLGDAVEAQRLLDGIDTHQLPAHAAGFVSWARAALAKRRGEPSTTDLYASAVHELLAVAAKHPAAWTALAACCADLALVQRAAGQADAARATLLPVAPIVRAHAPRAQLAELSDLLPPAHA